MANNLPSLHHRETETDPLEAKSVKKAIHVGEYNGQAMALGDESKEEWILAPACYGLDWMR